MAILSTSGNNLAFNTPDLQNGFNNLSLGISSLGQGIERGRAARERDRLIKAMEEEEQPQSDMPALPLSMRNMAAGLNPSLGGMGRELDISKMPLSMRPQQGEDLEKKRQIAAISARAHGIDTGGYEAMMQRKQQDKQHEYSEKLRIDQEALALADKNTMGAFGQLTENDNKAQSLFGNINSASRELAEYKAQNAARLSDPMVQATIKATEDRINEMKSEYQNRKAMGDQMAQTLLNSNQGRYGYINDYVNARDAGRQQTAQTKTEEPAAVSDSIEYTPEQAAINKYISGYKSFNSVTSDTDLENILASLKIPVTQTNREYLHKRLNSKAANNLENEKARLGLKGTNLGIQGTVKSQEAADQKTAADLAKFKSLYNDISKVNENDPKAVAAWVKTNEETIKAKIPFLSIPIKWQTKEEQMKSLADFKALKEELKVQSGDSGGKNVAEEYGL